MTPLVSVIIPVYQTKEYLKECIDSVLSQKYRELEIILVDDGSTDGSGALCDTFAGTDPRMRVIHKENGGLSSARNAGIEASAGEYITFIDSDDMVADCMIEEMVRLAQSENADLVKIGLVRKKEGEDLSPTAGECTVLTGHKVLPMIYKSAPQIISGCGKLFCRDLIGDMRFPEGRYYEDEYFLPRMYERSKKVVLCERQLYFYMQRENDSIMRGKLSEKKINDSLWIVRDRLEFYKTTGDRSLVRKAEADYYYKIEALLKAARESGLPEKDRIADDLSKLKETFRREHFSVYAPIKVKEKLYSIVKRIKK